MLHQPRLAPGVSPFGYYPQHQQPQQHMPMPQQLPAPHMQPSQPQQQHPFVVRRRPSQQQSLPPNPYGHEQHMHEDPAAAAVAAFQQQQQQIALAAALTAGLPSVPSAAVQSSPPSPAAGVAAAASSSPSLVGDDSQAMYHPGVQTLVNEVYSSFVNRTNKLMLSTESDSIRHHAFKYVIQMSATPEGFFAGKNILWLTFKDRRFTGDTREITFRGKVTTEELVSFDFVVVEDVPIRTLLWAWLNGRKRGLPVFAVGNYEFLWNYDLGDSDERALRCFDLNRGLTENLLQNFEVLGEYIGNQEIRRIDFFAQDKIEIVSTHR